MAASVYTTPTQNNPYVLPVDLGLLAKVNQYKQSIFYQNAERENAGLNQLNNLDIINEKQRGYLKNKVSNLVNNINDMGGLDYSDANVSNSLQGYTADVYNDGTILNSLESSKNLRSYINNTNAIKSDPKLSKAYDPAREWWDMESEINPNNARNYIEGDLDAKYRGPTAPTPYLGNDFDLIAKSVKELDPTIEESFDYTTNNRFFIDKKTNERVPPERIRSLIDGKIDGKLADQLMVHAAYNYYGLTGGNYSLDDGIKEYVGNAKNLADEATDRINVLNHDIAVQGDNQKRAQLQEQLDQLQGKDKKGGLLKQYNEAVKNGTSYFTKVWNDGKVGAFHLLYKNKLSNDVVNAYSYDQTKHQLIVNQEAVYNGKLEIEAAKQGKKVQYNSNGSVEFVDDANVPNSQKPLSNMTINTESSEDLEKDEVSQSSLIAENSSIQEDSNNALIDLVHTTADHAGIEGLKDYSKLALGNDPTANPVLHPDLVRQIAMLTGGKDLSIDDINSVLNMNATGNDQYSLYNLRDTKDKIKLTPEQVAFFKNVKNVMDRGANGENIDDLITDSGQWKAYLKEFSIKQNAIDYNKLLISTAYDSVIGNKALKLSDKERGLIKDYIKNPSKYYKSTNEATSGYAASPLGAGISVVVPTKSFFGHEEMGEALRKIGGVGELDKKVDAVLNKTATRNNYYNILFPDSKKTLNEKYPTLVNYIWGEIGKNEDPDKQLALTKKDDISATSIVTNGKDYYIAYSDNGGKNPGKTGYAKIEPQNISALNIPVVPYPYLEKVVSQYGKLIHPIYIDPVGTGNKFNRDNGFRGPIKVQVNRMGGSIGGLNNIQYEPSILYNNKQYYFKFGNSNTANSALEKIRVLIQDNKNYTSIEDLLQTLIAVNNQ